MNKKTYKLLSLGLALSLVAIGVIKDPIFAAERYAADEVKDWDGQKVFYEIENTIEINSTDGIVGKIIAAAQVHSLKLYAMVGKPNVYTYTAIKVIDGRHVSGAVIVTNKGDSV